MAAALLRTCAGGSGSGSLCVDAPPTGLPLLAHHASRPMPARGGGGGWCGALRAVLQAHQVGQQPRAYGPPGPLLLGPGKGLTTGPKMTPC